MKILKARKYISGYELVYSYGIKQAPTRIFELRKAGYNIKSRRKKILERSNIF